MKTPEDILNEAFKKAYTNFDDGLLVVSDQPHINPTAVIMDRIDREQEKGHQMKVKVELRESEGDYPISVTLGHRREACLTRATACDLKNQLIDALSDLEADEALGPPKGV